MVLNRTLQREILLALRAVYPDSMLVEELPEFVHDRQFMGNLFYLQEHGLIEGGDIREPGRCRGMIDARITRHGLDFLADDGGLQAVRGGLSIGLNAFDVVAAVEASLAAHPVDVGTRTAVVGRLRGLAVEDLRELVLGLIQSAAHADMTLFSEAGDPAGGAANER